jgi:diadenosine tetraphosphatase ApaH/serine/threonine PP2A family protein phosphatase
MALIMSSFAVVSDIHGNILALRAILDDISRRKIKKVFDLGDDASGPLWPLETTRLLMKLGWTHASGNHDRLIATAPLESLKPSDAFASGRLGEHERLWLGNHPRLARAEDGIVGFHGRPDDDEGYLVELVENGRVRPAPPDIVASRLDTLRSPVILCGHTHLQRCIMLSNGSIVVNPGSVGLPAYAETENDPHVVESGSPHARYAIVSDDHDSWSVEFILLGYEWNRAADKARAEGRGDWERALRTGFMR